MAREKKIGRPVSFKLDLEICDRLNAYSEESGVPKTKIVERALDKYLAEKSKEDSIGDYSSR